MYTLKKHPFAFLHCLGWFLVGVSMLYALYAQDVRPLPFPQAAETAAVAGILLFLLSPLLWLVTRIFRKRTDAAARRDRLLLRSAAASYMRTQPEGSWRKWLLILALALLLLAVLSVGFEEDHQVCFWFMTMGLGLWLFFVWLEWPEARLLTATDTERRFQLQNDLSDSQLDALYQSGRTLGMPKKHWQNRQNHLYNMLAMEYELDDHTTITVCSIPGAQIASHFGLDAASISDEEFLWIPFDQFGKESSKQGIVEMRRLLPQSLNQLADSRYETIRSTVSEDYAYTSVDVELQPKDKGWLKQTAKKTILFTPVALHPDADNPWLYQGCMLALEGAQLERIEWDTEHPQEDESSLCPAEADEFYRHLLKGTFEHEVCHLIYQKESRQIGLEVFVTPASDGRNQPTDSRGVPYALDDGLFYLLTYRYDRLKWHWMNTVDPQQDVFL